MKFLEKFLEKIAEAIKKWLYNLYRTIFFCIKGEHDYKYYYWYHEFPEHSPVGGTEGDKIKYCTNCGKATNLGFCM